MILKWPTQKRKAVGLLCCAREVHLETRYSEPCRPRVLTCVYLVSSLPPVRNFQDSVYGLEKKTKKPSD